MSADLEKMAIAFNTTISALEDELMALILEGQIQARIDSHNKVRYYRATLQYLKTDHVFLIIMSFCTEETNTLHLMCSTFFTCLNALMIMQPIAPDTKSEFFFFFFNDAV